MGGLLQDIGCDLPKELLTYEPNPSESASERLLAIFSETEPIDEAWTAALMTLKTKRPERETVQASITRDKVLYQRIYDYIFYRQLETFADSPIETLACYAARNTDFIALTATASGNLPEALRRWSEQIEYDTDNVRHLKDAVLTGRR